MTLLTKVQLKDYEPGEFTDSKQSTCQETLDIIEHFPWSQQKDHFIVSLTGPSITMEGSSGDYLKLALYYHDKFILYYFDGAKQLYALPITTLSEARPFITSFFDNTFTTDGFKNQTSLFKNYKPHFVTKDFHYTMHAMPTTLIIVTLSVFWTSVPLVQVMAMVMVTPLPPGALIFLGIISLISISVNILMIALLINHHRAAKGKVLIISGGNPIFYYGPIDAPIAYNKKDVKEVVCYGLYRGLDGIKRTKIVFNDGRSIDISGLIQAPMTLSQRFPQNIVRITKKLPFIPLSASIPS